MSSRSSEQDQTGYETQTVGVRLGQGGLDLRDQTDGTTLVKLLNARFRDDRTVERRNGYTGVRLRDAGDYPIFLDSLDNPVSSPITPTGWLYGHGQVISATNVLAWRNTHIPEPGTARGCFSFDDSQVAWTGDRLLVVNADGSPALGTSTFWDPEGTSTPLSYGIPAYMPVQSDDVAPETIAADYPETAVTDDLRFVVGPTGAQAEVWVTKRSTGALIDHSLLGSAGGGTAVDTRVFVSGANVVVLWRVAGGGHLVMSWWSGVGWTTGNIADASVDAYDVCPVDGGFYVAWRSGTALKVGRFIGRTSENTPFTFGTALTVTGGNPNGAVAIAAAPLGDLSVVWAAADGLYAKVYTPGLVAGPQVTLDAGTVWTGGLSATYRTLATRGTDRAPLVVHAGDATANVVKVWELHGGGLEVIRSDSRHNSRLASKGFLVGNEVFAWVRSVNASTLYLIAGAQSIRVAGYADREAAATRTITDSVGALSMVAPDPSGELLYTWARPYVTGQAYRRPGNALVGDMNFLPRLSAQRYGRSVYLAGSAVRNWDGASLGHAGFQDYPVVQNAVTMATGGSLTVGGKYRIAAVPVRYNARGERFEGAAVISSEQTLTASNTKITWQIQTLPSTDHADVVFEIWRNVNAGGAFYLEGTVANSLTTDVVTFDSTISDTVLSSTKELSTRLTLIPGAAHNHLTFGPVGSEILAVVGDRLWSAGGQVPPGFAQYSTLKTQNLGAGFDAEDGPFQWVDTAGGAVVSIAALANGAVFLQRDRIQVITDNGPDNFGNGSFSTPQLVLSDGATTHFGTAATQAGVVYWGDNGPRLLDQSFRVQNIGLPVRQLTEHMDPSGVRVDLERQEVVWFTEDGTGVLLNYMGGIRWAEWSGIPAAGCDDSALVTTDGRIFYPTEDVGDDGAPFEFAGATGELRPEQVLAGSTIIVGVGVVGAHLGPHQLRLRVYYNGSPLWSDEWTWHPETGTGLTAGTLIAGLTAAQVDALKWTSQSGGYSTHKRTSRGACRSFRVEWSDVSSSGPTFIPYEISLELGARGGFGRVTPGTFSRS